MYCFQQFRLDIKELQSDRMFSVQEINSEATEFAEKKNLFYWTRRQTALGNRKKWTSTQNILVD